MRIELSPYITAYSTPPTFSTFVQQAGQLVMPEIPRQSLRKRLMTDLTPQALEELFLYRPLFRDRSYYYPVYFQQNLTANKLRGKIPRHLLQNRQQLQKEFREVSNDELRKVNLDAYNPRAARGYKKYSIENFDSIRNWV
jgi:hypothetical protein